MHGCIRYRVHRIIVTRHLGSAASLQIPSSKLSNPYRFSVTRSAAVNSTAGSYAKVNFDNELADPNNNFSTGTYTVPVTGTYLFIWKVNLSSGTTDNVASLYVNGAIAEEGQNIGTGATGTFGATIIDLSAGNTVEVYLYTASSVALRVGSRGVKFNGILLRAN